MNARQEREQRTVLLIASWTRTIPNLPIAGCACTCLPPQVLQPFTETKFNFKKAYLKEVLIQFEPRSTTGAVIDDHSRVVNANQNKDEEATFEPLLLDSATTSSSPNLVGGECGLIMFLVLWSMLRLWLVRAVYI